MSRIIDPLPTGTVTIAVTGEYERSNDGKTRWFDLPNGAGLVDVPDDYVISYEAPTPPAEPAADSVVRIGEGLVFERWSSPSPHWSQVGEGSRTSSWQEIRQLAVMENAKIAVLYEPDQEGEF